MRWLSDAILSQEKFVGRSSIHCGFVFLLSGCAFFAQQSSPAHPAEKPSKLCVAGVGNGSLQPIQVNQVKDDLLKKLTDAGLNVDSTGSATQVAKKLDLSGNNTESMRFRKCEYMLLTAVDSKPGASKASDNGLLLSYALFQTKVSKPLFDTSVEAPASDSPTQSILQVLDKEVAQVSHLLPKK
jgi:hypothetical protein